MVPVTHSSLENEIAKIQNDILVLNSRITTQQVNLEEKKQLLKKLEEYESTPIEQRTLKAYLQWESSTVSLMDRFDSLQECGFYKYARLILDPGFSYYSLNNYVSFLVERTSTTKRTAKFDITMSKLKAQEAYALFDHTRKQLKGKIKFSNPPVGEIVTFKTCVILRAQNSSNRRGYGSIYNGYELVHQGTLYGETTNYYITGVVVGHKMK